MAVRVRKQDRRLCLRRVCRLLPGVVVHLLGMSENGVSFVLTFLTPLHLHPPPPPRFDSGHTSGHRIEKRIIIVDRHSFSSASARRLSSRFYPQLKKGSSVKKKGIDQSFLT